MKYKRLVVSDEPSEIIDVKQERLVRHIDWNKGDGGCAIYDFDNDIMLDIRQEGELDKKGFWLNTDYDWIIGMDGMGELVLVPLLKKEE